MANFQNECISSASARIAPSLTASLAPSQLMISSEFTHATCGMNRDLVSELRRATTAGDVRVFAQRLANRLAGAPAAVIIAPPVGPVHLAALNQSPAERINEVVVVVWLLLDPTDIDSKQTTFIQSNVSGRMHDYLMKALYRLSSSVATICLNGPQPRTQSFNTMPIVYEVSETVSQEFEWTESAECLGWMKKVKTILNRPEFVEERPLPCELLPFLLLSSGEEVSDPRWLAVRGVTHVYSCCFEGTVANAREWSRNFSEVGIEWHAALGALDEPNYPMLKLHFSDFESFVYRAIGAEASRTEARELVAASIRAPSARVLVHCSAGVNRSGLLGVAMYMKLTRVPLLQALNHCCEARGPLLWNESFRKQLVSYARDEGLLE